MYVSCRVLTSLLHSTSSTVSIKSTERSIGAKAKGLFFVHLESNSMLNIVQPDTGERVLAHVGVYTHWNAESLTWQAWLSHPGKPKWEDITKQYNDWTQVFHPTLPGYSLTRNMRTKYECPSFVQNDSWANSKKTFLEKYGDSNN